MDNEMPYYPRPKIMTDEKLQAPEEKDQIGKIVHYFSKISVAIVELSSSLKVGQTIRIIGSTVDFTQEVDSIEIEHKKIEKAKPGDVIGIKVNEKVREGYKVYRV